MMTNRICSVAVAILLSAGVSIAVADRCDKILTRNSSQPPTSQPGGSSTCEFGVDVSGKIVGVGVSGSAKVSITCPLGDSTEENPPGVQSCEDGTDLNCMKCGTPADYFYKSYHNPGCVSSLASALAHPGTVIASGFQCAKTEDTEAEKKASGYKTGTTTSCP